MESFSAPQKFFIPFARDAGAGYTRPVPAASQIGIQDGAASMIDGFPPLCFLPVAGGGVPPFGQDFNGLLNQTTNGLAYLQAGFMARYDSVYSGDISGYPRGAVLLKGDKSGFWISTVEDNTSNPDTGGANWVSLAVSSFNGRVGTVVPEQNDYSLDMLSANEILIGSGYQYGAGSRIDQWVELFCPASLGATNDVTITYPIPFPTHSNKPRVSVFDANCHVGGVINAANQVILNVVSNTVSGCVVHFGTNGGGARDFTICLDVMGD